MNFSSPTIIKLEIYNYSLFLKPLYNKFEIVHRCPCWKCYSALHLDRLRDKDEWLEDDNGRVNNCLCSNILVFHPCFALVLWHRVCYLRPRSAHDFTLSAITSLLPRTLCDGGPDSKSTRPPPKILSLPLQGRLQINYPLYQSPTR